MSPLAMVFASLCALYVMRPTSGELIVWTAVSNVTDGLARLRRSVEMYGIRLERSRQMEGGDCGISFFRDFIAKQSPDDVIMLLDGYHAIITADAEAILRKFENSQSDVLFSGVRCLSSPVQSAQLQGVSNTSLYPGYKALIGKQKSLLSLVAVDLTCSDVESHFLRAFLDQEPTIQMKIDVNSSIFQCLDSGESGKVKLYFRGDNSILRNVETSQYPSVLFAVTEPGRIFLNTLGNYVAKSWDVESGCLSCLEDVIDLETVEVYPSVVVALFVETPTPFFQEFLSAIQNLDYPKSRIHIWIHNNADYHMDEVETFLKNESNNYAVKTLHGPEENLKEWHARNLATDYCLQVECDYVFYVDSIAQITDITLKILISQNRSVIAPMLVRPSSKWSNFWGSLDPESFYARSFDYVDLVEGQRIGVWNVPFINAAYLVNGSLIKDAVTKPHFINNIKDPDIAFATNMRNKNIFMYVSNTNDFGHLVNPDGFETTHFRNELYQISNNRFNWELRYIHENYSHYLDPDTPLVEPCNDVFWFPVVSERFCKEIIDEMVNNDGWGEGKSKDPVPTHDIHLTQVGLHETWMEFIKLYVYPLALKAYGEYLGEPYHAINFVVRYKPEEQAYLRPHHDSSSYTFNIALNRHTVEYKGGGTRFVRQNCNITDTKLGWLLLHPGKVSHLHEGLPTTEGTRYIMVSFVDP